MTIIFILDKETLIVSTLQEQRTRCETRKMFDALWESTEQGSNNKFDYGLNPKKIEKYMEYYFFY